MDNAVIRRVEMAVRSVTGSSGRGSNSEVHNRYQRDFSGNMENTPLMTASSRVDLNIDQDRNDETGNVEYLQEDDFPALRLKCDQQSHTHHNPLLGNSTIQLKEFF